MTDNKAAVRSLHLSPRPDGLFNDKSSREAWIFHQRPLVNKSGWLCRVALGLALGFAVLSGGRGHSAGVYPQQVVRMFVPYGPGGAGDLTSRLLADKLSQSLKQPFVVENRPGAGGIAAMRTVLDAPRTVTRLASWAMGRRSAGRCSRTFRTTC
jgi:hypothetical protein